MPKPVVQGVVRRPVVLRARCAGVVRRRVVRKARCAGVVRRRVVRNARYGQPDRVLGVVPFKARCAGVIPNARGFPSRPVVPGVIPNARGSLQGPLCRCDSVLRWSAHAAGNPSDSDRSAEHGIAADRFAREIAAIFDVIPCSALAAAECQPVGPSTSNYVDRSERL